MTCPTARQKIIYLRCHVMVLLLFTIKKIKTVAYCYFYTCVFYVLCNGGIGGSMRICSYVVQVHILYQDPFNSIGHNSFEDLATVVNF